MLEILFVAQIALFAPSFAEAAEAVGAKAACPLQRADLQGIPANEVQSDEVFQCNAGPFKDLLCETDEDCYFCAAPGPNKTSCLTDDDCRLCKSGPNRHMTCADGSDCPGTCTEGASAGQLCSNPRADLGQCPGVCTGGAACQSSGDCPAGETCTQTSGVCKNVASCFAFNCVTAHMCVAAPTVSPSDP